MRYLIIAFALICCGCTERPNSREQALIAEVEKRVQLPKGAGPLRCYKRYYFAIRDEELEGMIDRSAASGLSSDETIVGVYRTPDSEDKPGIQWVKSAEDIPEIYDGGCSSMSVWYMPNLPAGPVEAMCATDFAGDIPEEILGDPLTC